MNYLAHAYLSFGNPDILVGNMVADSVKGNQINNFSENIQKGIYLHRQIDEFTDKHSIPRELKSVFSDAVGRYSASFLDIAFDHFLATDNVNEPAEGWEVFSQECYYQIDGYVSGLNENFQRLFYYMKKDNWLYNYRYDWLIKKSFEKLAERAVYLDDQTDAYNSFQENYSIIKKGYKEFFPDLKKYVLESFPVVS